MKKLLKISGYVAGTLLGVIVIAAVVVYSVSNYKIKRHHELKVAGVRVPSDAASIEKGKHIVAMRACADCHAPDFGGQKVIDNPAVGIFHGANLTHGQGGLPADYSDLDYVRAIRHGVTRDGRGLALMPAGEYSHLSDEDLGAVIAYLKTLAPVDRARVPIQPGPVIRVMLAIGKINLDVDTIDHNAGPVASIAPEANVAYGKYLATSCMGCHGPNLSGGKIAAGPPDWPPAANLTLHESGHTAHWTEEQFIQTLRTTTRPDGTKLSPVMPKAFGTMTDIEVKALWAYIRSLPAVPQGAR
ncbi:MAG TPA: cytochrome c [Opitutaceae bacterium]|nr:cytochrome c [Opitutaceae bacterium]